MASFKADHVRKRMEQLGVQRVEQLAQLVAGEAQKLAPIDTGELRQSIRARKIEEGHARVSAHAPHALYVELGTRYMRAQPYLRPALHSVMRLRR